jgi:hypothetical protein
MEGNVSQHTLVQSDTIRAATRCGTHTFALWHSHFFIGGWAPYTFSLVGFIRTLLRWSWASFDMGSVALSLTLTLNLALILTLTLTLTP